MGFDSDEEAGAPVVWPRGDHAPDAIPVDRTMVLPRHYTGETMLIPVERPLLRLRVTAGPDLGRAFSVGSSGAEVGRLPSASIVLTDPAVSRHHARIEYTEGGYRVVDLNSANGIHVNGVKVAEAGLSDGDVITLGHNLLAIEISKTG